MFNKHPALEEPEEDLGIQETREEKSNDLFTLRFYNFFRSTER